MSSSASNSSSNTNHLGSTAVYGTSGDNQQESSSSRTWRKHAWVNLKLKIRNTYVFLGDDNVKDMHLMRQVATERPYEMGYGLKEKKWADVASNLNGVRINLDETLFGEIGVSGKQVKTRFLNIMSWCKAWQESKPFGSGTDDEETPSDLLNMIEEEFQHYEDALKDTEAVGLTKQRQQKRDREQARIIRESSMGRMSVHEINVALDEDPHQRKRKANDTFSSPEKMDISSLIDMAKNRMSDQEDRDRDKVARRQLSIDRLQLDRERFNLDKTEREERMENDRQRNAQQAEMQKSLLNVINKVIEKFD